jgi:hypothetical protein
MKKYNRVLKDWIDEMYRPAENDIAGAIACAIALFLIIMLLLIAIRW